MLVLYHDYCSPASVVAGLRIQALADDGVEARFVGLDLLGIDTAIGPTVDQLVELEALRDTARSLGIELRVPVRRPPTLAAHLVGDVAEGAGRGRAWHLACWRGYWEDGRDLGDRAVLLALARDAGLDPAVVASHLDDPGARLVVRRRSLAARSRGIGGVPVVEAAGALVTGSLDPDQLRELAGW